MFFLTTASYDWSLTYSYMNVVIAMICHRRIFSSSSIKFIFQLLMGGGRTRDGVAEWGSGPLPATHIIYKIGVYGWRKRCLYALLLGLILMIVINFALTIWIIRVMNFTVVSMNVWMNEWALFPIHTNICKRT